MESSHDMVSMCARVWEIQTCLLLLFTIIFLVCRAFLLEWELINGCRRIVIGCLACSCSCLNLAYQHIVFKLEKFQVKINFALKQSNMCHGSWSCIWPPAYPSEGWVGGGRSWSCAIDPTQSGSMHFIKICHIFGPGGRKAPPQNREFYLRSDLWISWNFLHL